MSNLRRNHPAAPPHQPAPLATHGQAPEGMAAEESLLPHPSQALSELLTVLRKQGYSSELVVDVLGTAGVQAAASMAPYAALWHAHHPSAQRAGSHECGQHSRPYPQQESPTDLQRTLISAFYLRQPTHIETLAGIISQELVDQLLNQRVLQPCETEPTEDPPGQYVRSAVDIRPISVAALGAHNVLIASDPDASVDHHVTGPHHVPGVGNAPLSLLHSIPALSPGAKVLDLGCGSGVLGLVLATATPGLEIVGTDISPRAVDYARANAHALQNGDGTQHAQRGAAATALVPSPLSWRVGSWFEPVSGEKFDHIIANPPFVIGDAQITHTYRDSGLQLDGATRLVVEQAPRHLRLGASAHILAGWALQHGEDPAQHIAAWLPSHGIRAWILQRDEVDPTTYVTTWLRDESLDLRDSATAARTTHWLDFLEANSIARIGLGVVHMHKIADHHPSEVTLEHIDAAVPWGTYLGTEVAEYFQRAQWLEQHSLSSIAAQRFALRPSCVWEKISAPNSANLAAPAGQRQGFHMVVQRLSRTDAPRWSCEVDTPLMSVISGLDPQGLALDDVAGLYCAAHGVDQQEFMDALIPLVVDLVRHGMLIPEQLLDPVMDEH